MNEGTGITGTSAPSPSTAAPRLGARAQLRPHAQESFLEALGIEERRVGAEGSQPLQQRSDAAAPSDDARADQAHDTAARLVATTLIQPILAEARKANQTPPPFGPTQAERTFGSLMDAQLAAEIARASSFPLVERIAADLRRAAQPTRSPQAAPRTGANA